MGKKGGRSRAVITCPDRKANTKDFLENTNVQIRKKKTIL
jgi:hypothetical protein